VRGAELKLPAVFLVIFLNCGNFLHSQERRAVSPSDCITIRDLLWDDSIRNPVEISPRGMQVAYLVKSENLESNLTDVSLYVDDLPGNGRKPPKLIYAGTDVSEMHWLADGQHIVVLGRAERHTAVLSIDVRTGKKTTIAESDRDIVEYSTDRDGRTIVYATEDVVPDKSEPLVPSPAGSGSYLVPFQWASALHYKRRRVFIRRRQPSGQWSTPRPLLLHSPFSRQEIESFPYYNNLYLSLSPNGKLLLIRYGSSASVLPDEWQQSRSVSALKDKGIPGIFLLTLDDLETGATTIPLKSVTTDSVPLWSPDSRSFVTVARSPLGSQWEREDVSRSQASAMHLFSVQLGSNGIAEVTPSNIANTYDQPLTWRASGELLFKTSANELSWFSYRDNAWTQLSSFRLPFPESITNMKIASDGRYVVGAYQDTTTPPKIFQYDVGKSQLTTTKQLNPQLASLSFATVKDVHWKTATGYEIDGLLLIPPGFDKEKRYPLVIQTHAYEGGFACGSADPSYAPQPIASSGILYLMRTYPKNFNIADEVRYYPAGYPGLQGYGGLQEAAFEMDIWDSAVDALDSAGMIDRNKVGIVGFSRKGWYVEFILAHAKTHFRAASATDSVLYSVGEYWLYQSPTYLQSFDAMYGGPPYGDTLRNWMKYSISFNLDKFHTPLLLEEMGRGQAYRNETYPPVSLARSFELFTGLNRLHKPVELYYYPNENHQSQSPKARLANVQRNLDWYRFWLQDYQSPLPADSDQFLRWRKLRELQQQDEAASN
jgi:dipeptidyl aminopeptidase/acylaminoacyl peptidase